MKSTLVIVSDCELCQAKGEKIHSDRLCWARPCDTCSPDIVVVLKDHIAEPDPRTREHLAQVGANIGKKEFGYAKWKYDFMRKRAEPMRSHYHFHLRRIKSNE